MRMFRRIFGLMLAASWAVTLVAGPETHQEALEQGKSLLHSGNHAEAFQHFQRALTADPTRHESYFYLAVVSFRMGSFNAAEEYGRQALARAPEAKQGELQEMLVILEERRSAERHEQKGDEALASGLMAIAAEEYRQSFLLFPSEPRPGLQAASIYAERLNRPLEAAILWNRIIASRDEASAAAASHALQHHKDVLDRVYGERMAAPGIEDLQLLMEAFPHRADPWFSAAAHYAGNRDETRAISHLAEAIKIGLGPERILERREFRDLLAQAGVDSPFDRFVSGAFGPDLPERMRAENRKEQEELDRERREQEAAALRAQEERDRQRREREAAALRAQEERDRQRRELEAAARRLETFDTGEFRLGMTKQEFEEIIISRLRQHQTNDRYVRTFINDFRFTYDKNAYSFDLGYPNLDSDLNRVFSRDSSWNNVAANFNRFAHTAYSYRQYSRGRDKILLLEGAVARVEQGDFRRFAPEATTLQLMEVHFDADDKIRQIEFGFVFPAHFRDRHRVVERFRGEFGEPATLHFFSIEERGLSNSAQWSYLTPGRAALKGWVGESFSGDTRRRNSPLRLRLTFTAADSG